MEEFWLILTFRALCDVSTLGLYQIDLGLAQTSSVYQDR
jgi:hypothetical protein